MKSGSLTFDVTLYFAANSDAELTSEQIADMFDRTKVPERLQNMVSAGYLQAAGGVGKGNLRTYRAGPRIRKIANLEVPQ